MRYARYFPLLLALLPATGCGSRSALQKPAQAVVQAARPPLTDDLIAEAWRENARRDSLRLAQMEAKTKATAQSFNDQIALVQRNAAALVENSHPLTVFGGSVAPKPATGSGGAGVGPKVDQVLGTLAGQGQQVQATLHKADAVARQMQEMLVLAQEIRAAQQALAGQQSDPLVKQGPAGILGLISLVLAFLLRRVHKQNQPPTPKP